MRLWFIRDLWHCTNVFDWLIDGTDSKWRHRSLAKIGWEMLPSVFEPSNISQFGKTDFH